MTVEKSHRRYSSLASSPLSRRRMLQHAAALGVAMPIAARAGSANAQEKIELTFMGWGNEDERRLYEEALGVFEEQNPGVTVEYIFAPQDYYTKLKTMIAGQQVPDVFYVGENVAAEYAESGVLLDLGPYIEEDPSLTEDFVEGLLPFGQTEDGTQYAIPKGWEPYIVYINKDLFKEAGIEVPTGDWTMDEFKEVARQLTVAEGDRTAEYGAGLETWWGPWSVFVGNEGGEWFKDGKSNFSDPAVLRGLGHMYEMFQVDESAPSPAAVQQTGMGQSQMFETGRVAMYPYGMWMVPTFRESVAFDWTVVEMPIGVTRINPVFSGMLAVSANSEHKDAAVSLLKFLMSKEGQLGVTAMGLQMPPYEYQMDDPELVTTPPELEPRLATSAYHGSDVQLAVARTGHFTEYIDVYVQPELDKAFSGDQTLEEAARKIDEGANENLFND